MKFDTLIEDIRNPPPVISVIRLTGVIGHVGGFRKGLSLTSLASTIHHAFEAKRVKAVALSINSPGGSPVQSSLIAKRIRQKAAEKNIPVIAFVEDVAASGGYWLACAADEIIADPSSIVGSVGVVTAGFGFQDAIARLGIERRVHTQGTRKAMLDPFRPEDPDDIKRLLSLQADMHSAFKDLVRERRGGRLKGSEDDLFNGDIWSGKSALDLGLIDGLGDLRSTCRDRYGERVRFKVMGERKSWLRRSFGMEESLPERFMGAIEERMWWARLGL